MIPMPPAEFLQLGPLHLRWYGLFAALAMLAGYFLLSKRARQYNFTQPQVDLMIIACVVAGIVGARIEYVRRFWDAPGHDFSTDFSSVFKVWQGGLVFQGGFLLAAIVILLLCWRKHWSLRDTADLIAPALPVAHAVARLGCLLNGCCFGRPWSGFCSVRYPMDGNAVAEIQASKGLIEAGAPSLPVIPVQFLESLWCLAIAGLILWLERRRILSGARFILYVLLYTIGRILLECLRGDYPVGTGRFTPAQLTSACVVIPATLVAIGLIVWHNRRRPAK